MSHGVRMGFSYTYSHATDEQSALGLFYNGNNPLNLREAYGSSDFDRTHVFNFSFVFEIPKTAQDSSLVGKFTNGWALEGIGVYQSGQPFSVIDYSGAIGSLYYGVSDGITNPIVPLALAVLRNRRLPAKLSERPSAQSFLFYDSDSAAGRSEWRDSRQ